MNFLFLRFSFSLSLSVSLLHSLVRLCWKSSQFPNECRSISMNVSNCLQWKIFDSFQFSLETVRSHFYLEAMQIQAKVRLFPALFFTLFTVTSRTTKHSLFLRLIKKCLCFLFLSLFLLRENNNANYFLFSEQMRAQIFSSFSVWRNWNMQLTKCNKLC